MHYLAFVPQCHSLLMVESVSAQLSTLNIHKQVPQESQILHLVLYFAELHHDELCKKCALSRNFIFMENLMGSSLFASR